MKTIDLAELKELQLIILNKVHNFCESNNLIYYLGYGTLLGAIRHSGYIPWDDDIDIIMPRDDYEIFIKTFYDSDLEILSLNSDCQYPFPIGKVSNKNTCLIEESSYQYDRLGVNIDVFPIDGLSSNYSIAKLHVGFMRILTLIMELKKMKISGRRSFIKNFILILSHIVLFIIPLRQLLIFIDKISTRFSFRDSIYVEQLYVPRVSRIVNKDIFAERELHAFENFNYYIPKGYDAYLKSLYGDYMILPSVAQRVPKHHFIAFWR